LSLSVASWLILLGGCVERKMTIVTDPPGAKVTINGKEIGFSPVNYSFIYYGKYRIQLQKDGYQTRIIEDRVPAPFYEYPPLDILAENINPFIIYDKHLLEYTLDPLPRPNMDELKERAEELRIRGQNLPPPKYPVDPPTAPPVPISSPEQPPALAPNPQLPAPKPVPTPSPAP
jgi:hypothetical protein